MGRTIAVEIPDEIAYLLEERPELKMLIKRLVEREIKEYLLKILVYDKLAEKSMLKEEDVIEIDKKIKRGIVRRLERDLGSN